MPCFVANECAFDRSRAATAVTSTPCTSRAGRISAFGVMRAAPSVPMRNSGSPFELIGCSPLDHFGFVQRLDARIVVAEDVAQHRVGVFAGCRRHGWRRQLLTDQLERERQLLAVEAIALDPREP